VARHTVDSVAGLEAVASKSPNAALVIPELADEESPEGWQVMGPSRVRVTAPVRQFIEHALYDLTSGIPEEYRHLPQVEEQREQLRSLLEGRRVPFSVELRELPAPTDPSSLQSEQFAQCDDGRGSEFLPPDSGGTCRPIDEQLGLHQEAERAAAAAPPRACELGAARELRRCVIAPGNGCHPIGDANWYGWLRERLLGEGMFDEVVCRDFPDPDDARREVWLPFMRDELRVDTDTVLVGHSSGAEAAMRLAEESPIGGLVLVSACHSDLGDEGERASGYYPPSGGPWDWGAIRRNAGWIVQFHSSDDGLVPVREGRAVAKELQSEYHELDGHSHFFEPFGELLDALREKMRP